jgi:hypothetical protein
MTHGRLLSALALPLALALATPAFAQQRPLPPGPGAQPPPQQRPPQQQPPQQQQPAVAPPRPYREIAVQLPMPSTDPGFAAFRKQLADVAMRKDRAGLGRLVVQSNFFWLGEKGDKADKKKSALDNLAAAIDLDAKDGSGWDVIAHAADEATMEPVQQRPGVSCSPASPQFDDKVAETVAKNTGTQPSDWAFPNRPSIEVHASAQANSPVTSKLGMHLVRVMPEEEPAGGGQQQGPGLIRIVTPQGKIGYVDETALSSLNFDQLCYIKDGAGWKIAGYAGGE